jgi:diaminopropionate ammonia-lyase
MKTIETKPGIRILKNENFRGDSLPEFLSEAAVSHIRSFHETVPVYRATPLVRLDDLADRLGVKRVYVKDESKRFGLNAFKGLGGIYAVTKILCGELGLDIRKVSYSDLQMPEIREKIKDIVFVTATDGNHGRGVAWAASRYGCKSYIYMTKGTARSRVDAVKAVGAEDVFVTDLNYDDTVRLAAKYAEENGWILTQDTAWEGYEEIPRWITQGYTTMGAEILDQLRLDGAPKPTHLFLQAGVGSFAGSLLGYFANRFEGAPPATVIVEPLNVACVFKSALAADGKPHAVVGLQETIMAVSIAGSPAKPPGHSQGLGFLLRGLS